MFSVNLNERNRIFCRVVAGSVSMATGLGFNDQASSAARKCIINSVRGPMARSSVVRVSDLGRVAAA